MNTLSYGHDTPSSARPDGALAHGAIYATPDSAVFPNYKTAAYTVVQRPLHGPFDFLRAETREQAIEMAAAWQKWIDGCQRAIRQAARRSQA